MLTRDFATNNKLDDQVKVAMNTEKFEQIYGRTVPPSLIELQKIAQPVRFEFDGKFPFVVEVQYFLSVEKQSSDDIEKNMFAFAVNTDGFKMLIDLADEHCLILQDELGDIDSIGVALDDLLEARPFSLGAK